MLNGDTNEIDNNLITWTVTQASSTKISISLTFDKPIIVSTGEAPDILFIQVFLSAYANQNGYSLPPAVLKKREIPQQFSSVNEAIIFTDISDSVYDASTIISSSNAGMNIVLQTSFN